MSGRGKAATAGDAPRSPSSTSEGSSALPDVAPTDDGTVSPDDVPESLLDAMTEAAWALPGVRTSFALVDGRRLRFLASVGPEAIPDATGWKLSLERAPDLHEALQRDEDPLVIEDVRTDPLSKPLGQALGELGVGSVLMSPIREGHPAALIGVLVFHAASARTWSMREQATMERLHPIADLSLHNARLRSEVAAASVRLREYERHAGAARGIIDAVLHDAGVLSQALRRRTTDAQDESIHALVEMLSEVLQELGALQDGALTSRVEEAVDLDEVVRRVAPVLRSILGPGMRLLAHSAGRAVSVRGSVIGVLRLLLHLVQYARRIDPPGHEIVVQTQIDAELGPTLVLSGDGLGLDSALSSLDERSTCVTQDAPELPRDLWQARSELLLQGARMAVEGDSQRGARIRIAFRPGAC